MGHVIRVLAIDPGRRTGLALACGCCAPAAKVVKGKDAVAELGAVLTCCSLEGRMPIVVIERPRIHSVGRTPGDPNDIVDLSWLAGELAGAARSRGCIVERYKPDQWKEPVTKSVHQARVRRDLERHGLATWCDAWDRVDHNGRDALALARWYLDCAGVTS